jgi:DNA-binding HxlR family transcriptional regulator
MEDKKRSVCPIACALDLIGDKWTLLVVRDLACGKRNFREFCASPEGIATNILASRLARLVEQGIVERCPSPDQTRRNAYRLTAKGLALGPVLEAVAVWGLNQIRGTKAILDPRF